MRNQGKQIRKFRSSFPFLIQKSASICEIRGPNSLMHTILLNTRNHGIVLRLLVSWVEIRVFTNKKAIFRPKNPLVSVSSPIPKKCAGLPSLPSPPSRLRAKSLRNFCLSGPSFRAFCPTENGSPESSPMPRNGGNDLIRRVAPRHSAFSPN
jgi:hypothetical protein